MVQSSSRCSEHQSGLNSISTHASSLSTPSRFVVRYGAAVRSYLRAILPTVDDADEVEQEFLLQVVEKGIPCGKNPQGRYRYYLIATVRNAAFRYLRKHSHRPASVGDLSHLSSDSSAELEWHRHWRGCLLQNTWNALRDHQARNKGNFCHSVLIAFVEHGEEDAVELAARVSSTSGHLLSAEAFRKQLSRARQKFAELLIIEVSRTLTDATSERLEDELHDLDLMKYVRLTLPNTAIV